MQTQIGKIIKEAAVPIAVSLITTACEYLENKATEYTESKLESIRDKKHIDIDNSLYVKIKSDGIEERKECPSNEPHKFDRGLNFINNMGIIYDKFLIPLN